MENDQQFNLDLENLKGNILFNYHYLKIKPYEKENIINDLLIRYFDFLQKNFKVTINTNNLNFE